MPFRALRRERRGFVIFVGVSLAALTIGGVIGWRAFQRNDGRKGQAAARSDRA